MSNSVMWKFLTAAELRAKAQEGAIVVLPVASIERHGPHLPVGVDTILSEAVCQAAAERIAGGTPVGVAPTLWCGMAEQAHSSAPPAGIARYRSFRDVTPSGGIGDARRARAQKGAKLVAACGDGIAAVLRNPQTWS